GHAVRSEAIGGVLRALPGPVAQLGHEGAVDGSAGAPAADEGVDEDRVLQEPAFAVTPQVDQPETPAPRQTVRSTRAVPALPTPRRTGRESRPQAPRTSEP